MRILLSTLLVIFSLTNSAPVLSEQITITSSSTGFFISDSGHLITAYHGIENKTVFIVTAEKKLVATEVIKVDKEADLALLKVAAITPFLYIAQPESISPGLEIATIGYPMMSVQGLSPKISIGIINSSSGFKEDKSGFQFDASTFRGSSGGPVIGPGGLIVGVVRGKLNSTKMLERMNELVVNVNYAISSQVLLDFLKNISGLPTPRPLNLDSPLRPQKIYRDARSAVVPVVSKASVPVTTPTDRE
jgi:S1-C subfamily serine protease